jgi:hypothetical protein
MQRHSGECRGMQGIQGNTGNTGKNRQIQGNIGEYRIIKKSKAYLYGKGINWKYRGTRGNTGEYGEYRVIEGKQGNILKYRIIK